MSEHDWFFYQDTDEAWIQKMLEEEEEQIDEKREMFNAAMAEITRKRKEAWQI